MIKNISKSSQNIYVEKEVKFLGSSLEIPSNCEYVFSAKN